MPPRTYQVAGWTIEYVPRQHLSIDKLNVGRLEMRFNEEGEEFQFEQFEEFRDGAGRCEFLIQKSRETACVYSVEVVNFRGRIDFYVLIDRQEIPMGHLEIPERVATLLAQIGRALYNGRAMPNIENIDYVPPRRGARGATVPAQRNIPANATNAITYAPITDGNQMVNFQGEFDHGRYYKQSTYDQLHPGPAGRKRNPFTQANITETTSYRARIRGGNRKTRRRHNKI